MARVLAVVACLALAAASCGEALVEPEVAFDDGGCRSSDVGAWPSKSLDIAVSNGTSSRTAVVMGTYADGFGRGDLVAYGSDVSERPDFIDALEILQVLPGSTANLTFDHGPGTFFMVCMPDANTMVVLDDVTLEE